MHSVVLICLLMHSSGLNELIPLHKRNHQITSVLCVADVHCGYEIYKLVIRVIYMIVEHPNL